jgi:GTP-binding protein Era
MSDATAGAATRCGFTAVIGPPNAGKSTCINAVVGTKVSIVSHKVQTTRMPMRGILVEGGTQLILIDTPGIFAPRKRIEQAMVQAAWGAAWDADAIVLIIDAARGLEQDVERILGELQHTQVPLVLALNKVDRVKKERLLELARALNARVSFAATFMISALNGDGVAKLKAHLLGLARPGPWHYSEHDVCDAPLPIAVAEITREKIYERLHDELPYAAAVETTSWREQDNGIRIEQTVFVERESQRKIALGKGGQAIKAIGAAAREEISRLIEKPVHLFLFVKVREGWADDPARYREMGLEFPRD